MIKKNIKFALGVEYDGSLYHGWQYQETVSSIQAEIEKALSIIADHKINVVCAGRTDAGVHSIGQVIHFSTTSIRSLYTWRVGVNTYLPKDISVLWAVKVSSIFNARYSAISRSYRYIIYNNVSHSALFYSKSHHVYKTLDINKMHIAGQFLLGEKNFMSFRACGCQSHSVVKKIIKFSVWRQNNWVIFDITANSFLYHMVRNIVGSLIEVGLSKKQENWIIKLLNKKNRRYAGPTAPAKGLYLSYVEYPICFNLPSSLNSSMLLSELLLN